MIYSYEIEEYSTGFATHELLYSYFGTMEKVFNIISIEYADAVMAKLNRINYIAALRLYVFKKEVS